MQGWSQFNLCVGQQDKLALICPPQAYSTWKSSAGESFDDVGELYLVSLDRLANESLPLVGVKLLDLSTYTFSSIVEVKCSFMYLMTITTGIPFVNK